MLARKVNLTFFVSEGGGNPSLFKSPKSLIMTGGQAGGRMGVFFVRSIKNNKKFYMGFVVFS